MTRVGAVCVASLAVLLCTWQPGVAVEPTVPVAQGFVSDFAGVIDAATRRELEGWIGTLKQRTGAEIAVVTVRTTQPLSAFDYAMKIAEAWRPGAAGRDNGVVFLVAVEDRELFILTGYGVEGALPDGRVGAIRDRLVVPAFRAGDYAGGIRAATWELVQSIADDAGEALEVEGAPARMRGAGLSGMAQLALLVALFGVLGGFLWFASRHPEVIAAMLAQGNHRRYERGGGFGGGFGGSLGRGGLGGFGGFGGGGFGGGGAGGRW